MRNFLTLDDVKFAGKTVLVRADLNVPVDASGAVTDATRLQRLVPTLQDLARAGAKIVVLSHFGRPKGKRVEKDSLKNIAAELGKLLKKPVAFADDCIGPTASTTAQKLQPGEVLVLENTRFHPEEEANDAAFAKQVAALGDIFVMDAFSAGHRAHATTTGLGAYLPAVAGRLMQTELEALDVALENPTRPVMALVGGAKISTKLDLLNNLVARVNVLVLGGGMANTFLAAQGIDVGGSLYEKDMLETARTIAAKAAGAKCAILLPADAMTATELKPGIQVTLAEITALPPGQKIFDIGPATIAAIKTQLNGVKTVVWNGPLGVFEVPPFDQGTRAIAVAVGDLTKKGKLVSVAGGGDTVAALNASSQTQAFTYVSAAGGAFLEWMEGKELPAITMLKAAKQKQAA